MVSNGSLNGNVLNIVTQLSWLKCRKIPVTVPVTRDRMKTMRDRTKKDNDLPAAAAGNLFPYKLSWLKMP